MLANQCNPLRRAHASSPSLQPRGNQVSHVHKRHAVATSASKKEAGKANPKAVQLDYGSDWYTKTREMSKTRRTVRDEMEYRREANRLANNGKERKDLYTDNWDGSEYKGSPFNILTLLAALAVLVPVAGLAFAYWSYGVLWG